MIALSHWFGKRLSEWVAFWRNVEGPELEPPVWHSHYLSTHVSGSQLHALGKLLRGQIIDIGAGSGHGMRYLDRSQSDYFPTDLVTGRDAGDRQITVQGRAPVFNCSVYDIPFPDGHFGGAMMLSVLEHLEFPQKALGEVFRVLKPGALMLVSTPFAFSVHGAPQDYRRWTPAGMERELRLAGFDVVGGAPCGAAFSSLTMNFHMTIRHHLVEAGPKWCRILIGFSLPGILLLQAIMNGVALLADTLDRSQAFPLAVVVLARKLKKE